MAYIQYIENKLQAATRYIVNLADDIATEYAAQDQDMTVRQVYYQFISRDILPDSWIDEAYNLKHGLAPDTKNTPKNYKRLDSIICKGRLAGLLDWDCIVDRTRTLRSLPHWDSPEEILESAGDSYRLDLWEYQRNYIEVWIEKDALIGLIEDVCTEFDVPYFSTRGYASQSAMWRASLRFRNAIEKGHAPVLFHLSDHDPSGVDMSRDIRDRLNDTFGVDVEVIRLGLTMEQIKQYGPPPNPAKESDSRARDYVNMYGHESWELDALEPSVLVELIRENISLYINALKWRATKRRMAEHKRKIKEFAETFGKGK